MDQKKQAVREGDADGADRDEREQLSSIGSISYHSEPVNDHLTDLLQRFFAAWDNADYDQADTHAEAYRCLIRATALESRLSHLERVMLEQERRLDALEGVRDD